MLLLAAALLGLSADSVGQVTGRITSASSGAPIAGALIAVMGSAITTTSDSAGRYTLSAPSSGPTTLRASAPGYVPLALRVSVPRAGTIAVDLALDVDTAQSQVTVLRTVRVLAHASQTATRRVPSVDRPVIDDAAVDNTRLSGELDPMRTLEMDPTTSALAVRTTLAVRGGSPDELQVLLDGIPLWSPYHAAAALSAVSPDAIGSVELHDGAPSAQYGGRLSGVLDLRTPPTPVDRSVHGVAAATQSVMRGAFTAPLPLGGSATVGARGLFDSDALSLYDTRWHDAFAVATLPTPSGTLRALAVRSDDRVSSLAGGAPTAWRSQAAGLVWDTRLGSVQVAVRAWDSYIASTLAWGTAAVASEGRDDGGGTTLSWRGTMAGASVERIATHYGVTDTATARPLDLTGSRTIMASFVEQRLGSTTDRWMLTMGVRGVSLAGGAVYAEPRATVAVEPITGLWLAAGYAREHQAVQSLRNDRSSLWNAIGIDLPATGRPIPLASADAVSASATLGINPHTELRLDAYTQHLDRIVLPGAATASPAALASVPIGHGQTHGIGLAIRSRPDPMAFLDWWIAVGTGTSTRTTGALTYAPVFQQRIGLSGLVGLRATATTRIRLGGAITSGLDTLGTFTGQTSGSSSEPGEDAATTPAGPVTRHFQSALMPAYGRVSIGVEQRVRLCSTCQNLSLYLGTSSLLARGPALALLGRTAVGPRVLAGLEWRF